MQKKIEINIPEGKVPVMEQTKNRIVITWKEKELTYDDIVNKMIGKSNHIVGFTHNITKDDTSTTPFYKKVEVLRKLTNIRNYFGGDEQTNMWTLTIDSALHVFPVLCRYKETNKIYFDTQEHTEQAIKMLGDELKYLFKPW